MTPDQIKKGRGALGLNQAQFAELLGLTRTTVTAWEKGHKPPRAKNFAKMKELFVRPWVGLTDEEKSGKRPLENGLLFNSAEAQAWEIAVDYAEAKLKEKNT